VQFNIYDSVVPVANPVITTQINNITKLGRARPQVLLYVMKKSGNKCVYCHKKLCYELGHDNTVTIDHIFPKSRGGKRTPDNVAASCFSCNVNKGASLLKYGTPTDTWLQKNKDKISHIKSIGRKKPVVLMQAMSRCQSRCQNCLTVLTYVSGFHNTVVLKKIGTKGNWVVTFCNDCAIKKNKKKKCTN
jgi:hypothetical protein